MYLKIPDGEKNKIRERKNGISMNPDLQPHSGTEDITVRQREERKKSGDTYLICQGPVVWVAEASTTICQVYCLVCRNTVKS